MTQKKKKSQAAKIEKVKKRALEGMRQPFRQKSAEEIQVEMRRQAHYGLKVYVSQWGDTLSQLALASGRDVVDLVHDNQLDYQDRIDTGSLIEGVLDDLNDKVAEEESQGTDEDITEKDPLLGPELSLASEQPSFRLSPEPARGIAPGKDEEKTSMTYNLFDAINQERQHLGLHALKEASDQGGFIRALNDQAVLYSYQDANQDLVTEIKVHVETEDVTTEEEALAAGWGLLKGQPLLYQQVTQALYRSHYASLQPNRDGYTLIYGLKTSE
ncbi:hypothetical protein ACX3VT_05450 [Aerococcus sanguinicola]|uniref:hypothetical protein n=1 Tax=unclassified Aerococcus TaxID=2618060 RepID=UPI0008A26646|nr:MULTISPECIES: hypothetical protein [unclassified Aerococcus]KAB0647312.1 hypothetical protein F6I01_02840 [Aerococcus sanguinicola]MDK6233226.1 hypothetical protein [Aerococcus sp. UMB10185]MDK6856063.1 hypothetical protein [Aerococcus sp. UMB7533]MDK8503025.1 hypothetical protein [Aerococcus sp. UMB1112A]OFN00809.1 hypothetical protein HMPREF2626_08480 [Aerococcus sp. HMSC062A02]